jgi:hypothetical protein
MSFIIYHSSIFQILQIQMNISTLNSQFSIPNPLSSIVNVPSGYQFNTNKPKIEFMQTNCDVMIMMIIISFYVLGCRHGDTALHCAARGNHAETVNVLLQMSANPTLEAPQSGNVYNTARGCGSFDVCKVLYRWFAKHSLELTSEMRADEEMCLAVDSDENSSVSEDCEEPAPTTPESLKKIKRVQPTKKRQKPALKSHLSGGSKKRPLPSSPMLRVKDSSDQHLTTGSPPKYRKGTV